jgi:protein O-GlcNAc transferase
MRTNDSFVSKIRAALEYLEQARLEEGEDLLWQLLEENPNNAQVNNEIGKLALRANERGDAQIYFSKAIKYFAANSADLIELGFFCYNQKFFHEAKTALRKTLSSNHPNKLNIVYYIILSHLELRETSKAFDLFKDTQKIFPNDRPLQLLHARILDQRNHSDEALKILRKLISANDAFPSAITHFADLSIRSKNTFSALAVVDEHIQRTGGCGETWIALANLQGYCGMLYKSIESYHQVRKLSTENFTRIDSAIINCHLSSDKHSDDDLFQLITQWAENHAKTSEAKNHFSKPINSTPKRLGIFSTNLYKHPSCTLLIPLLEQIKDNFELFIYQDRDHSDEITAQLKAFCHHWKMTTTLTGEELISVIRADKIDVLIDDPGHFDNSRVEVFKHRAAPMQIEYHGGACSTGLTTMDYRISDEIIEPAAWKDRHSSEKIMRLPHGCMLYRPMITTAKINELPFEKNGFITFGSVTNLHKITDTTMHLWAAVVNACPNSKFFLARDAFDGDQKLVAYWKQRFEQFGITENQLILRGDKQHTFLQLKLYHHIDINLDTFPYAGVTTTCDCLWMGVPVITLQGTRFIGRKSSSILHHVGLTECIATTEEEFIILAKNLATDTVKLSQLRKNLRQQLQQSPVGNAKIIVDDLTKMIHQTWQTNFSLISQ